MSDVINAPACYLLVRQDNQLLFVLRANTGFMDGQYSLPAGHVEAEEPYSAGAVREAFEEVGLQVEPTALRHVFTMHRYTPSGTPQYWTDVFFEAREWHGEPVNNEPDKHSEVAWLPADDLPLNIMDYQRYALMQIAVGETYGEFGWTG